ncbi:MAG: HPr(Ser) kinase/phosphatase [Acidobacteriota bacterium]
MEKTESCIIPFISIKELLSEEASDLQLRIISGEDGIGNMIRSHIVQKPGLALSGYMESISPASIQILGKSEISFLYQMEPVNRKNLLKDLCSQKISCFVLTDEIELPQELMEESSRQRIPILKTMLKSPLFLEKLQAYLEDKLSPRLTLHGVLVDIYGLGVLLLGESGVGKSECALDLIVRGHRLVSDDAIEIRRKGETLVGKGVDLTRYHMEIRGIGIINIKDLFGVTSVRYEKNVEFVIRLDRWVEGKEYDRLGIEEGSYEILGMELPYVEMPVAPGRNISVLIEVAARNQLLKRKGDHSARKLVEELGERLKKKAVSQGQEGDEL